jgi:hypothetical protein
VVKLKIIIFFKNKNNKSQGRGWPSDYSPEKNYKFGRTRVE